MVAAVLVFGTITAFAGPSVSDQKTTLANDAEIKIDTSDIDMSELSEAEKAAIENKSIEVSAIDNVNEFVDSLERTAIPAKDLKDVITSVNDPNKETMSVKDAVDKLVPVTEDATKLEKDKQYTVYGKDGKEKENADIRLEDYHFVSSFDNVVLDTADGETYQVAYNDVPTTLTLQPKCLDGVEKNALGNYLLMVYNPETGKMAIIELNPDSYNPPELTVDLPFLGMIAFIQK